MPEPSRIETRLYEADGKRTDDASRAIRAEVVEVEGDGRILRLVRTLGWEVDRRALEGDAGEAPTRPSPARRA